MGTKVHGYEGAWVSRLARPLNGRIMKVRVQQEPNIRLGLKFFPARAIVIAPSSPGLVINCE